MGNRSRPFWSAAIARGHDSQGRLSNAERQRHSSPGHQRRNAQRRVESLADQDAPGRSSSQTASSGTRNKARARSKSRGGHRRGKGDRAKKAARSSSEARPTAPCRDPGTVTASARRSGRHGPRPPDGGLLRRGFHRLLRTIVTTNGDLFTADRDLDSAVLDFPSRTPDTFSSS